MVQSDSRDQRNQRRNPNDLRQTESGPTFEEIRLRAFQIFEARGRGPGRDVEDWVQAEQELRWND